MARHVNSAGAAGLRRDGRRWAGAGMAVPMPRKEARYEVRLEPCVLRRLLLRRRT
jgi:hypothetical protein